MSDSSRKAVIVIGSGQSARLVATRLRSEAAESGLTVIVLGPGEAAHAPGFEPGLCQSLAQTHDAVIARLVDGRRIIADAAVLATGCSSFGDSRKSVLGSPRHLPHAQGLAPDGPLLLLGSGSRAIRYALAAVESGHRGPITFIGRCEPVSTVGEGGTFDLSPADIPLGTGLRFLLRWFRQTESWATANGIGVRELVNGLRPHVPLIWQHLTASERRRFVVHLRSYWLHALDSLKPDERLRIGLLFESGQAVFRRGRCLSLTPADGGVTARIRRFPSARSESIAAALAINFEDTPRGRSHLSSPVIAGLLDAGLARPDDIEYGLDVTENCALIDSHGRASARLFAVGAPTRGRFVDAMEIDCIRRQSERVALSIFDRHINNVN